MAATEGETPASKVVGELEWTGRLFGGLIADVKRRAPFYRSDWVDAFRFENLQMVVSTIFFLFFVAITPVLTFGAIMGMETDMQLGVVETILSTSIVGIIYSFTAGQPLCIQGPTGPELAYTLVFFQLCEALDLEFLPARAWQALWCSVITMLLAVTDACALMHHFTRFVEDIFAALISWIFIFSALRNIVEAYIEKELSYAFLRTLLAMSTYLFTMRLRGLDQTVFFNETTRTTLANFAAPLAILVFSALANVWREEVDIEWLEVPGMFEPSWVNPETNKARSWFVNPMGINKDMPLWAIFAIIVPAAGLALLGFLDQNLTTIIVNRPSNALRKPGGYHLDLFVCGLFVYPICGLLGLPFPHNSTAPSLIHLLSLSKYEEHDLPGGGKRKAASGVVEQRFTNFAIHCLVGLSLVLAPLLGFVPQAVTFGIFLVMGVTSMAGNQLFERWQLWSIFSREDYPQYYFVKHVRHQQLHRFTFIQVMCFLLIFFITEVIGLIGRAVGIEAISLVPVVFPFLFGSLVFVRKAMGWLFTERELAFLDARIEPTDSSTTEDMMARAEVTVPEEHKDDASQLEEGEMPEASAGA